MKTTTKFLLLIMTFFMCLSNTKAETINISTGDTLIELKKPNSNDKITMSYLYSEDSSKVFYTYNPEISYAGGNYKTTYDYPSTGDNLNKIWEIAYFGYGYQDRTDISWYVATQYLIWNTFLNNESLEFITSKEKNNYQELIDTILSDIEHTKIYPSFTWTDYQNENILTNIIYPHQDLVLIDENNVLQEFEITNDYSFTYHIDKNKLTLNFNYPTTKVVSFKRIEENVEPVSTYKKDNSFIFNRGKALFTQCYTEIKALNPKITISLEKDKNYYPSLSGIKYGLYYQDNDDLFMENTSDENGQIIFEDVYAGDYYIKEIEPSYNYLKDDTKIPVEINEDNLELNIKKNPHLKNITFTKYLENADGTIIPDANSEFTIYNDLDEEISNFKTNSEGEAIITLPYGEYTIKENNPTIGYQNENISLRINSDTKDTLTITSKELVGTLNITFKDYLSQKLINGITTFKIQKVTKSKNITNNLYETENGLLVLDSLSYGDYIISDIVIPNNYKLETNEISFSITEDNNVVELTIYSELKTGSIIIKELDKETGLPISNATFRIYNDLDELLWEKKTNKEGIIKIDNVPLGNYYLKKVLSTESNIESDEKIEIEVKEDIESTITINNRSTIDVPITGSNTNRQKSLLIPFFLGGIICYGLKKKI